MVCPICNGTGLIPVGKWSAFVDCECKLDQPEVYTEVTPDMFDFPCSDTFRAFSYQYCNRPDPAKVPATKFIIHEVESKEPVVAPPVKPSKTYTAPVKTFENDKKTVDGMQKIGYRGIK